MMPGIRPGGKWDCRVEQVAVSCLSGCRGSERMHRRKRGIGVLVERGFDMGRTHKSVIGVHLNFMLYGHWAVNDPRGSGSTEFGDEKFEPLGPIHFGRKPAREQPSRAELKAFHAEHEKLLNFDLFWIDDAKRKEIAAAIEDVIKDRGYTCYACAICGNHLHLVIRTHRDKAPAIWDFFAEAIRARLRLRFADEIPAAHPVISARPYNVFLYTPDDMRGRIVYVEKNPEKEGLPRQHWGFVKVYNGWPLHKGKSKGARDA